MQLPLTSMGILTPGSVHARPSAQAPIDVSKNFQHTFLQSNLKISPRTFKKSSLMFRAPSIAHFPLCPPKIGSFELITFLLVLQGMPRTRGPFGGPHIVGWIAQGPTAKHKPFCDLFEISPFSRQNSYIWGVGGVYKIQFSHESSFFCYL